jgi:glycosyltransferase involved in cell wall biosynthesis
MTEEVQNYFSTPQDKIDTIFNGINTERFDALAGEDLQDFRNRYASPNEKLVFHVGRMVDEKGVRIIINSAHQVLRDCPEAKFVISGTGPQLLEYRHLAYTLGLGQKFYFTGFVSDDIRNKLYKVADVVLCPSLYEPFGIVALEAMAACSPVVVTDTGGMSEVVSNYENGIKVFPNNPDSLAWGILHTLNNPDWARGRVRNAYEMVKKYYNWERIALQTITVYERVIRERKASNWGNKKNGVNKTPEAGGYTRRREAIEQTSANSIVIQPE